MISIDYFQNKLEGINMVILHVLANGPPDVNGYAIRTQMILKHQKSSLDVMGLTSPWYPQRDSMIEQSQIDGITYQRTIHPLHRQDKIPLSQKIIRMQTRKEQKESSKEKVKPASNIFVKAIKRSWLFF